MFWGFWKTVNFGSIRLIKFSRSEISNWQFFGSTGILWTTIIDEQAWNFCTFFGLFTHHLLIIYNSFRDAAPDSGSICKFRWGSMTRKKLYTWEQLGWAKGNGHSGRSDVGKDSMPATRPEIWPKLLFRGSWIEVPKKYYNYLAEVKKKQNKPEI